MSDGETFPPLPPYRIERHIAGSLGSWVLHETADGHDEARAKARAAAGKLKCKVRMVCQHVTEEFKPTLRGG